MPGVGLGTDWQTGDLVYAEELQPSESSPGGHILTHLP